MKTILYFFLAIVAVFSLSSCSQEGKYKDFATRVASAISQNDTAALKKMIYGGDKVSFSNFEFTGIDVANAKMVKLDEGGYRVESGAQYLEIKPTFGDSLSVVKAGNLFTCKDSVMTRVAKQRGFIKDGDDDITVLRKISSDEFKAAWKQYWDAIKQQEIQAKAAAKAQKKIDAELAKYKDSIDFLADFGVKYDSSSMTIDCINATAGLTNSLQNQVNQMSPSQRATFESLKSKWNSLLKIL